ncbi:mannonate dehydratase [Mesorhizobium sp. B2-8-1]|nr:mannonate dehydratase [Mesorhizobium sp. B2-8-1]
MRQSRAQRDKPVGLIRLTESGMPPDRYCGRSSLNSFWTCSPSGPLRFNAHEYAAFDCFMLERTGAEREHTPEILARATAWFDASSESARSRLLANIMAGLPGAYERYDVPGLKAALARYHGIGKADLRQNFMRFLAAVIPTAEEVGINMCVHPNDPPRPSFGLPRIVSNAEDIALILDAASSRSNGLTLCSGSLGAGADNDVPAIAGRFAERIHFAHLRNVAKESDGSFMEADHLGGDTDMVAVVTILLRAQKRRLEEGRRLRSKRSPPTVTDRLRLVCEISRTPAAPAS